MGTVSANFGTQLYYGKGDLKYFQGSINMFSPRGVCSSFNTSRNQQSKISVAAKGIDKLLEKKISISSVGDTSESYVEYYHGGDVVPVNFLVRFDKASKEFTATVKNEKDMQTAIISVVACILFNEELKREVNEVFGDAGTEMSDDYQMLINTTDPDYLFKICDAMYYGIAKDKNFNFLIDEKVLDDTLRSIKQKDMIHHCPETAEPKLLSSIPAAKKPRGKRKAQTTLFNEPLDIFFERCKKGEFLIKHEWPDNLKNYVVPLSFLETFIPTEGFREILLSTYYQIQNVTKRLEKGLSPDQVIGKNPINIKVMGKPGTGKTTVIEAVLASLGYPKGFINCKDRMEEDEIEGQNKFINGQVWNIPTKVGELHPAGGAIVLEEFNLPDPGILQGALGQALAYPFILKVDGYREFKRSPFTIYFATMNIGTNGTKPMNEALSSRFPEGIVIEDVKEEEFVGILKSAGYDELNCKSVYDAYQRILNYLRTYHEELVLSLTLRHCLSALDKLEIGFSKKQAYENTFISQLYSSDPEVARDVENNILTTLI